MIEEQAIVTSVETGFAEVEIQRRSSCSGCSARDGCGVSLLDRILGRRPQRLLVANALGVRPGDAVVIGVPEGALLKAAVAAYLVPLGGLIGGGLLGEALSLRWDLGFADALPLLGAVAGLGLGLLITRHYSRRLAADPRWRAVLVRRATSAAVPVPFPSTR